jgi:NTP pyrophosphatase (non-canonical NTP hydrolase)
MKLNEYQELSKRTLNTTRDHHGQLANYALGLAGETGEVVDLLKKNLFHAHVVTAGKLTEELGDVLFYVAALATTCGLTLKDITRMNVTKLQLRYPDGFDPERSRNRES